MSFEPIAVTGLSVLFPGSTETAHFWRDIIAGKDLLSDVPESYWQLNDYFDPDPKAPDRTYSRRGGFIPEVPFDPLANGLPPNVLPVTDNSQLLSLIVAERVLAEALSNKQRFPKVNRDKISVILGATGTTELISHMSGRIERPRWEAALRASGMEEAEVQRIADRIADEFTPWQENTFPGFLGNVIAGRICNRLDLGGTNCVVDAACASSLAALRMAVQELHSGDSEMVLTGGVDALNVPLMYMAFSKTGALSRSGDCRPYSDQADGTMLSDGLGMLALRRLVDAEQSGDRIYAVLRGLGSSSDGRAKSIYAPVAEGQAKAVRRAYEGAGFAPTTVELIEGHGTGTIAGDKAEVGGLCQGFAAASGDTTARQQWCALGSIKSQIGHAKGAAGVAGLFKVIMALHHKMLPPTIKVERPNPAFDIANSPFYLNTQLRPWIRDAQHPRRAGVSGAGFGGTNFHVVVEEYTGPAPKAWKVRPASSELVLIEANDASAVVAHCEQMLLECVATGSNVDTLQRLARRSQEGFTTSLPARLAIVAMDLDDLQAKLRRAVEMIRAQPDTERADPSGIYFAIGKDAGKIGFLFPGQGSQYVGMGQELTLHFDAARSVWDHAANVDFAGVRLHEVVFPRPSFSAAEAAEQQARLTRTEWAQPALATCSMAALAVLRELGVEADCVAGHSFGELSALGAAGTFDLLELVRAARRRGELMASASAIPGAMTAVRASAQQLAEVLGEQHPDVLLANRNSPRQVVLSGPTTAIAAVEEALSAAPITYKRLAVATAFHSPLVSPSVEPFHAFLESLALRAPKTPVYNNTTAAPYPSDAKHARQLLANQLANPVRFEEIVQNMWQRGIRTFIEVGAGSALTGLVGECLAGQPHVAFSVDRKNQSGLTSLWHGLGQLAVGGVKLNWNTLWQNHQEIQPTTPPPAHAIMIGGASKGRRVEDRPHVFEVPSDTKPTPAAAPANRLTPILPSPEHHNGHPTMPPTQATTTHLNGHATPPVVVPTRSSSLSEQGIQSILSETAKVHETFQNVMAESCQRFFESVERILQHAGPPSSEPVQWVPPTPSRLETPVTPQVFKMPEAVTPVVAVPHTNGKPKPTAPAVTAPATTRDLEKELVCIVAEKTGYPTDLLTLDMDMEADLGIDSIKRVEIMSALETVAPGMASTDPANMLSLHTLAEVLAFLRKNCAATTPTPSTTPPTPTPAPSNLEKELVRIVAEKTGYPTDLLTLDMDMEADLGIDSIKRVEIMSALETLSPTMASNDPAHLLTMRTLGDVLGQLSKVPSTHTPVPTVPPVATAAHAPALDLEKELVRIVAEKTGYPTDLLTLDMDMEADLGIDSIKRVEIMSALETVAPGVASSDPANMLSLRTLADILVFLRQSASPTMTCEIPTPTPSEATAFPRHVVRVVETPAPGFAMAGLRAAGPVSLLVATDSTTAENKLARLLAEQLSACGLDVAITSEVSATHRGAIFLGGLRPCNDPEQALRIQRDAFQAAKKLAQNAPMGGIFVTLQDTGGDFGFSGAGSRAWLGGLAGLAKTAALEWPQIAVKAIDLQQGERSNASLVEATVRELFEGGSDVEVGLCADGRRVTLVCAPAPLPTTQQPALAAGDVVVVSGGARGVTAAAIQGLANVCKARFVLLGRTPQHTEPTCCRGVNSEADLAQALVRDARANQRNLALAEARTQAKQILQQREIEANLATLRQLGAAARYVNVDVRDRDALSAQLAIVRREWGAIRGIVHGAGVLADRLIKDKTLEQLDQVFSVKIDGLRALLAATESDPLRLLCLFSSVAGRFGNPGQSDYSMANEVLNKIAHAEARRRHHTCVVKSINWGAWEGGMVTPVLQERFAARGVRLLPLAEGARQFAAEVCSGSADIEVVLGVADFLDPLKTQRAATTEFDVFVDPQRMAYLRSHCVEADIPVLPAVLVLEWFTRVGHLLWPGQQLSCNNFKVLAGVPLPDFDEGTWFRIVVSRNADRVEVVLTRNGVRHYSANLEPVTSTVRPSVKPRTRKLLTEPALVAYENGSLFHGPQFQALRAFADLSGHEASAELSGTAELDWGDESWFTDPAALDGGLQLALLWGLQHKQRKSLPTHFERFVQWGSPGTPVRHCELKVRPAGRHEVIVDLLFSDDAGQAVAEMSGVTMTLLQSSKHKVTT